MQSARRKNSGQRHTHVRSRFSKLPRIMIHYTTIYGFGECRDSSFPTFQRFLQEYLFFSCFCFFCYMK